MGKRVLPIVRMMRSSHEVQTIRVLVGGSWSSSLLLGVLILIVLCVISVILTLLELAWVSLRAPLRISHSIGACRCISIKSWRTERLRLSWLSTRRIRLPHLWTAPGRYVGAASGDVMPCRTNPGCLSRVSRTLPTFSKLCHKVRVLRIESAFAYR